MANKRDLNAEMEKAMAGVPKGTPLLLHACCGPCCSATLERLATVFSITVLYFNPNIWPKEEYARRWAEVEKLPGLLAEGGPLAGKVQVVCAPYEPEAFAQAAKGLEAEPEGGARCEECFRLRLNRAAAYAAENGFPWFGTTLSISPHKNAPLLNRLGEEAGRAWGVSFLPADLKKKDGYKRSLALSRQWGLYRQEYCGCVYSLRQRQAGQQASEK